MKAVKKLWSKITTAINTFFALQVIKKKKKVYTKYPEGIQSSMICFREVYKLYPEFSVYVKQMYKDIAEKELRLETKLEPVKKGNVHYHIIVCKDRQLKTVFFLERHADDGKVTDIKPSYSEIIKS